MSVKIAVIGLESSISRLENYVEEMDDVTLVPFVYKNAEESKHLISKTQLCDVILFTGPIPFLYATEELKEISIPAVYVPYDEFMVTTSFFRLKNEENQKLQNFSIDIMNESHVIEVMNELELKNKDTYMYGFGNDEKLDIGNIVKFHLKLWNEKKIDYVLTTIKEVETTLTEKGVLCYRMKIPNRNLERAIDEAKVKGELKVSKSSQIVVGIIKVKNFDNIITEKGEFYGQELLLRLHQLLLNFSHSVYASIINNGNNSFVIFGTRGILDYATNNYQDFPLVREIEDELKVDINFGFGFGLTANQADRNAKLAFRQGKLSEGSSCYIVDEFSEVIGPLGDRKINVNSNLFRKMTEINGFSNEIIIRLSEFYHLRNNTPFSAEVLADYNNVTKRSAERMIRKLLDNEVVSIVGEEKPYQQGRPRQLYQFIMGDEYNVK